MALVLYKRKNSSYWWIRGSVAGEDIRESTQVPLTRKRVAEEYRVRLENEILLRSIRGVEAGDKTFKEGVTRYLEMGGKYRCLGSFNEKSGKWSGMIGEFGDLRMNTIGMNAILNYAHKTHIGVKAATINREVISPMIAVYNANDVRFKDRVRKMVERPVKTKSASPELFNKSLEAYSDVPNLHALVLTMTFTGRRIGELLSIMRTDVDWESGEVDLGLTKNGDQVVLKFPKSVMDVIENLPEYRNGRLFRYSIRHSVYEIVKRKCKKAGIEYM